MTDQPPAVPPEVQRVLDRHPLATIRHDPELPLQSIDLIASVTNQVRFEPIDQPTVDRYVAALEDSATFPEIIVREITTPKTRQLVNLGGNHRTRAHIDAGRATIAAFIITCNDLTALEIAYADNANHGLPPTDAERLAHCLILMEQHGRSGGDAARTVGINVQRLYKHISAREVEKRAANLGVAVELASIAESVRPRFGSLQEDRVFAKVIRVAAGEKLTQQSTFRLIGDVNSQGDVASAMDVINLHVEDHRNRLRGRGRGRPSSNPHIMLRTALGTVRGLNAADVVQAASSPAERDRLAKLCMDGARHLKAIHDLAQIQAR